MKTGEWTLLLAEQKNLILENDVIEVLKRLLVKSSEEEMQQHIRDALKYLKKTSKIQYSLMILNKKQAAKERTAKQRTVLHPKEKLSSQDLHI